MTRSGFGVEVFRPKSLHELYTQVFQLGAHRWVDVGIATTDTIAELFGNDGQATHEGATDILEYERALLTRGFALVYFQCCFIAQNSGSIGAQSLSRNE